MFWSREARVERLVAKCERARADFDSQRMMALARRLQKLRHTSGFGFEAEALQMEGRLEEAVQVLDAGLERAVVWPLLHHKAWLLLVLDRLEEADAAFEEASRFADAPKEEIARGRAEICLKRGQFSEALAWLPESEIADFSGSPDVYEMRIAALLGLNRLDEAEAVLQKVMPAFDLTVGDDLKARIKTCQAKVERAQGRDSAEAAALEAVRLDPSLAEACENLRELRGHRSADLRCWQVVATISSAAEPNKGYCTTLLVNAETLPQVEADIREALGLGAEDTLELSPATPTSPVGEFRGLVQKHPGNTYFEGWG